MAKETRGIGAFLCVRICLYVFYLMHKHVCLCSFVATFNQSKSYGTVESEIVNVAQGLDARTEFKDSVDDNMDFFTKDADVNRGEEGMVVRSGPGSTHKTKKYVAPPADDDEDDPFYQPGTTMSTILYTNMYTNMYTTQPKK